MTVILTNINLDGFRGFQCIMVVWVTPNRMRTFGFFNNVCAGELVRLVGCWLQSKRSQSASHKGRMMVLFDCQPIGGSLQFPFKLGSNIAFVRKRSSSVHFNRPIQITAKRQQSQIMMSGKVREWNTATRMTIFFWNADTCYDVIMLTNYHVESCSRVEESSHA